MLQFKIPGDDKVPERVEGNRASAWDEARRLQSGQGDIIGIEGMPAWTKNGAGHLRSLGAIVVDGNASSEDGNYAGDEVRLAGFISDGDNLILDEGVAINGIKISRGGCGGRAIREDV